MIARRNAGNYAPFVLSNSGRDGTPHSKGKGAAYEGRETACMALVCDTTVTENELVRCGESPKLHGRRQIFTGESVITDDNVIDVLEKALPVHRINRAEEIYLYDEPDCEL